LSVPAVRGWKSVGRVWWGPQVTGRETELSSRSRTDLDPGPETIPGRGRFVRDQGTLDIRSRFRRFQRLIAPGDTDKARKSDRCAKSSLCRQRSDYSLASQFSQLTRIYSQQFL